MSDLPALSIVLAAAGGVLVGLLFFGTLWWTVRRLASARNPALLVAGTFLIRTAVAAIGIVIVSRGELLLLLVAVGGFLVARTTLIRVVGRPLEQPGGQAAVSAPAPAQAEDVRSAP